MIDTTTTDNNSSHDGSEENNDQLPPLPSSMSSQGPHAPWNLVAPPYTGMSDAAKLRSVKDFLVLLHNLTLTYFNFQIFASNLTIPYPVQFCLRLGLKNRGAENNASAPHTLRIEFLKTLFDQICLVQN